MGTTPALSIVMPVLDEGACIDEAIEALEPVLARGVELIVVDGGSRDDTVAIVRARGVCVITAARSRALQMNAGAATARASMLLFLHADTMLPADADQRIVEALAARVWGRFDIRIVGRHWMLPVVATMMNLRSRSTGIATGDQALFMRRDAFEAVGGFPAQPLMEDIAMSVRLRAHGRPACLTARARTSGRRWERHGVWRTILLMWRLRFGYWWGEAPAELHRRYYGTPR
ncbi:MAG: TIGR04283 family arsenosugar biosynthesis glycosyltransferase [Proteobacteria bacterium]|nr:TIGR04283 family arsenosugar biosynthesis glycosyltransferase [Burkholderiales bacterium]